ncbi:MAG: SRPBCC domain-containing protein [Cyanothece sp. SIO1E1]|nr:SRPBCC domain-containing protein [Cyanothece sp. SIO1E1]
MPSLYAEIEINAPKRQVWQALFHKDKWFKWNTFLFDCDPTLAFEPGQAVLLSLRRLPGEEETEFQPLITLVQPEICLQWVAKIPGLLNEHTFELQEIGPGRTKYIHRENFSGVLTRLFLPFIRLEEQKGLRRMARELKQYVERNDSW